MGQSQRTVFYSSVLVCRRPPGCPQDPGSGLDLAQCPHPSSPPKVSRNLYFVFLYFSPIYSLFWKYLTFQAIQDFWNKQHTSFETRPIEYMDSQLSGKKPPPRLEAREESDFTSLLDRLRGINLNSFSAWVTPCNLHVQM